MRGRQLFQGNGNPGAAINQATDDITGRVFRIENTGGWLRAATRRLALRY